jgi:hypothetical protein
MNRQSHRHFATRSAFYHSHFLIFLEFNLSLLAFPFIAQLLDFLPLVQDITIHFYTSLKEKGAVQAQHPTPSLNHHALLINRIRALSPRQKIKART